MKKYRFLVLILITSCVQSKISTYTAFPKMVVGESIVLMAIDELNDKSGFHLYEIAKKKLSETNQVLFFPELEYDLINNGIDREKMHQPSISDSTKMAIAKHTGSRYIMNVQILSSRKGQFYSSYTTQELSNKARFNMSGDDTSKASLLFTITDTKNHLTEFKFQVKTTISPLSISEENGETNINISTDFGAISESFKKGIRKLRKEIIEN